MWATGETPAVAKVTATPGPGVPGCWSGWSGLVAVGGETSVGSLPHGDLRRCLGHFTVAGGTPFQARLFVRWGTEILSPSAQGVPVDDEPLTSAIILDGLTGKPVQQVWFLLLRTVGSTYPRQNRGVARRSTKVETCS